MHGVGNKVADCICLFSLGFLEAFPIDVWIERVINEHYPIFSSIGKTYKRKSEAARLHFGRYAGYAQEFLFHYTRTQKGSPSC
jgi:N-glycosylase/DNA lyase